MRSTTAHLALPFFDDVHRDLGQRLADWMPQQHIDESDDRQACKEWVKLLGANQWLRYCVPAGKDGALGGALEKLDSRALVILRETLAFHSPLADFAFAMQGLGSGAITLAGTPAQQAAYLPQVASGAKIAAFALSEPDAGSDAGAMVTSAVRHGRQVGHQRQQDLDQQWRHCGFLRHLHQDGSAGRHARHHGFHRGCGEQRPGHQ
jgi:acyl-CoA dehydrogenase